MRPTAANAALRPFQILARSSALSATCSRVQLCRSQIAFTCSNCSAHSVAGPSSSTTSAAAASRVYPACTACSAAWMARLSIISTAAGTMPAATMSLTTSPASRTESKSASRVRTVSGTGSSRTVISQTMPSVPSEPMNTPRRSGPSCSVVSPPRVTSSPSGRTTVIDSTWLVVKPFQAVGATGVLGDVAADGAHLLAGGVGCEAQPVLRGGLGDVEVGDPGLECGPPVERVDLQDAAQSLQGDDDAVGDG